MQLLLILALVPGLTWCSPPGTVAADAGPCESHASDSCLVSFKPSGSSLDLHYYLSRPSTEDDSAPTAALIVMHGHPRDANKTFEAGLSAVKGAGQLDRYVIVAPLFQVAPSAAKRCSTIGVPAAQAGDLLWTCQSWMEGAGAENDPAITSFAAIDALIVELHRRWPTLRKVTFAGFSAGAQMVQHYIAFAAAPPQEVKIRYVVADPGTWLYFDTLRPVFSSNAPACTAPGIAQDCSMQFANPDPIQCPTYDQWKYGTDQLPARLHFSADQARRRYLDADVSYIEGALDQGQGPGTASGILDHSCAADLQGPYRLQRGMAYTAYVRQYLRQSDARTLIIVAGCAHDVACVFPSIAARRVLIEPVDTR